MRSLTRFTAVLTLCACSLFGTLRASAASVQRYLAAVRSEGPRPKMITYEARRVYTNQDFFEEWQATHSP